MQLFRQLKGMTVFVFDRKCVAKVTGFIDVNKGYCCYVKIRKAKEDNFSIQLKRGYNERIIFKTKNFGQWEGGFARQKIVFRVK